MAKSLGDGCGVVVVVPFREQLPLQHRGEQLARFVPHMRRFLSSLGVPARVLVVEQSQDGRKFNRGQLLNVGCLGCARADRGHVLVYCGIPQPYY